MAKGPGKYDPLVTIVREATEARAVILLVIEGSEGSGFAVQQEEGVTLDLPALLRRMANSIEGDLVGN
jgi:hypothetical protein